MKRALGSTYILYFIMIFLVILFAFLIGTVLYYKAYKVDTILTNAIEKFEGYNKLSYNEINTKLGKFGYTKASKYKFNTGNWCNNNSRYGKDAIEVGTTKYMYCIYELEVDDNYYKYGVKSYITFDVPIFDLVFNIPVYAESERIYKFNE